MPRNTSLTLHQAEIGAREIRSTKAREREALQADIRCEINRVQTIQCAREKIRSERQAHQWRGATTSMKA